MKIKFFTFFLILFCVISKAQVVINEFVASNKNGIVDEYGSTSDWIEIYNASSFPVSLNNWSLSDDEEALVKWTFPDTVIGSEQFMLVFCSGSSSTQKNFHANFKISSSGEDLFLVDNLGNVVDSVLSIPLDSDVAYGRAEDGAQSWVKFISSTPETSNITGSGFGIVNFSHLTGFYKEHFDLSLLTSRGDASVYFTINGDRPNPDSNSTYLYSGPIPVKEIQEKAATYSYVPTTAVPYASYYEWKSPREEVEKHVVIRAGLFLNNKLISNIQTHSYFIGEQIFDHFSRPILSIVLDSLSLFDHNTGIYLPGKHWIDGETKSGNFSERGEDWEKPATMQLLSKDGVVLLNKEIGLRIHGNLTRAAPQKGLQFYARSEYDGESRMNYNFFSDRTVSDYKRVISRSFFGSALYSLLRDPLAQDIASQLNLSYQASLPVITFINGEYWGTQNIREKQNEYYLEQHFGVNKDSIDVIGLWGAVEEGNKTAYNGLLDFFNNNDISLNTNYDSVKKLIDIPAFIDYYIAETFFNNHDWPNNNLKLWRERKPNAKWRWIFYDLDASLVYPEENTFDRITAPEAGNSMFIKALLSNELFISDFVERYVEVLNKEFRADTTLLYLEKWKDLYEVEFETSVYNRWGFRKTKEQWLSKMADLETFLMLRPCELKSQLESRFGIDAESIDCTISREEIGERSDLNIYPNPSSGKVVIKSSDDIVALKIYDINGRVCYASIDELNFISQFDITPYKAGVYFFECTLGSGSKKVKRVVKL